MAGQSLLPTLVVLSCDLIITPGLFTPAGNPPSPADYDKLGHVSGGMVNEIASWVDAQHGELK